MADSCNTVVYWCRQYLNAVRVAQIGGSAMAAEHAYAECSKALYMSGSTCVQLALMASRPPSPPCPPAPLPQPLRFFGDLTDIIMAAVSIGFLIGAIIYAVEYCRNGCRAEPNQSPPHAQTTLRVLNERRSGAQTTFASNKLCLICTTAPSCVAVVPCGHIVLCQACVPLHVRHVGAQPVQRACPVCQCSERQAALVVLYDAGFEAAAAEEPPPPPYSSN
jgi:hypothetical protein